MYRGLFLSVVFLMMPITAPATPYLLSYYENFEDDELDYPFHCSSLVEEPPGDPSESYAVLASPSLDGSTGLHLVQGSGGQLAFVALFYPSCIGGLLETIAFDLESPPGRSFGAFDLYIFYDAEEYEIHEYSEPGSYTFECSDEEDIYMVFWAGHDVVIDNLSYSAWCGFVPTEAMTWGSLKAVYR